jgi:hypothetical protein
VYLVPDSIVNWHGSADYHDPFYDPVPFKVVSVGCGFITGNNILLRMDYSNNVFCTSGQSCFWSEHKPNSVQGYTNHRVVSLHPADRNIAYLPCNINIDVRHVLFLLCCIAKFGTVSSSKDYVTVAVYEISTGTSIILIID